MSIKPRCAICGRVTFKPAMYLGGYPVGAVCAKRFKPEKEKPAGSVIRDDKTIDMFMEVNMKEEYSQKELQEEIDRLRDIIKRFEINNDLKFASAHKIDEEESLSIAHRGKNFSEYYGHLDSKKAMGVATALMQQMADVVFGNYYDNVNQSKTSHAIDKKITVDEDFQPVEMLPTGIEAQVCLDIAKRQQLGINKYGTTVAENPLELRAWLQHAYEETLDKAIYLRRAIAEIDKKQDDFK